MVNSPQIHIKPVSRHHGQFLVTLGAIGILLCLFIFNYLTLPLPAWFLVLLLASIVCGFYGILKLQEPAISLIISPQSIFYNHRYGSWKINWEDIQRFDIPTNISGFHSAELPYIGINLKSKQQLIQSISPRLASRLIHEQRPLIMQALTSGSIKPEVAAINFAPYSYAKQKLTGPVAAFCHHSDVLHHALGYHLYLPQSALDRDCQNFCQLLKQCQNARVNQIDVNETPDS